MREMFKVEIYENDMFQVFPISITEEAYGLVKGDNERRFGVFEDYSDAVLWARETIKSRQEVECTQKVNG